MGLHEETAQTLTAAVEQPTCRIKTVCRCTEDTDLIFAPFSRGNTGNENLLTNPGLVELHRKGPDQVFQERPDQPEVDATDTPGAVHQNHDVGYGWRLTHKPLIS